MDVAELRFSRARQKSELCCVNTSRRIAVINYESLTAGRSELYMVLRLKEDFLNVRRQTIGGSDWAKP
jgi:hypothetical protein